MSFVNEIVTRPLLDIEESEASGGTGGTYGMPNFSASFLLRRSSAANAASQSKTLTEPASFSELLVFSSDSCSSSLTVELAY